MTDKVVRLFPEADAMGVKEVLENVAAKHGEFSEVLVLAWTHDDELYHCGYMRGPDPTPGYILLIEQFKHWLLGDDD